MAMSRIGRISSPSTHSLHKWPPDQFPPASLTRLPVASTIFIPLVERGKVMSSTLNKIYPLMNYNTNLLCAAISCWLDVWSTPFPIRFVKLYNITPTEAVRCFGWAWGILGIIYFLFLGWVLLVIRMHSYLTASNRQ